MASLTSLRFGTNAYYTNTVAGATRAAQYDYIGTTQANYGVYGEAEAGLWTIMQSNGGKLCYYHQIAHYMMAEPGVANDIIEAATNSMDDSLDYWLRVDDNPANAPIKMLFGTERNLFDWRKESVRDLHREAFDAQMASYPFDGVFFDNATMGWTHLYSQAVSDAMTPLFQQWLLDIRAAYPSIIMVGNCADINWQGLNGEMVETGTDPSRLWELTPVAGQASPNFNIFYDNRKPADVTNDVVIASAEIAFDYDAIFMMKNDDLDVFDINILKAKLGIINTAAKNTFAQSLIYAAVYF